MELSWYEWLLQINNPDHRKNKQNSPCMSPGLGPYFVPLRKTLVPLAIKENNQVLLLVGPLNECWLGVKQLSLFLRELELVPVVLNTFA